MRILVVEDEYKVARALKEGLSNEGYAVDVVNNGDDGFAMARNELFEE